MAGGGPPLPPATSTRLPRGSVVLVLMVSVHLVVQVAGSSLCDRCETQEVLALRRYYLSLNLPSVYITAFQQVTIGAGWLDSRVVSVLDSGTEGPGFKSQPWRCRVTVLGEVFTPIVCVHQAAKLVAALLRVAGVTAGLAEVLAAYIRVCDSRHLQADYQAPGSAPEPYAR